MNPSIASTVALRNTNSAVALANKYGYTPRSKEELIMILSQIIATKKDAGLHDIALIHPDRDLILSTASSSACGCGHVSCNGDNKCAKCSKQSNANGDTPETTNAPTGAAPSFFQAHQSMIITVVAIVAIAYIFKHN